MNSTSGVLKSNVELRERQREQRVAANCWVGCRTPVYSLDNMQLQMRFCEEYAKYIDGITRTADANFRKYFTADGIGPHFDWGIWCRVVRNIELAKYLAVDLFTPPYLALEPSLGQRNDDILKEIVVSRSIAALPFIPPAAGFSFDPVRRKFSDDGGRRISQDAFWRAYFVFYVPYALGQLYGGLIPLEGRLLAIGSLMDRELCEFELWRGNDGASHGVWARRAAEQVHQASDWLISAWSGVAAAALEYAGEATALAPDRAEELGRPGDIGGGAEWLEQKAKWMKAAEEMRALNEGTRHV